MRLQSQSLQRGISKNLPDAYAPEKINRMVDNTGKQITRLTRLIDDMLDISRIQSGKLSMHLERVNLKDIIQEVYEQLKEQLENSGSKSELELSDHAIGLFDHFRIEQVVTNLITNAIRYGEGKEVKIKLEVQNGEALIKVQDHGMGIAPENFDVVFNRFERITSTKGINGLGLGLYITKQIINAHLGKIRVESQLGKGSTFIVELPLRS